jgi:dihydrolipoamide dehydrogenase
MARTEVKVPDIGGYDDVPVIELLVAVGDTVKLDQGLVTLESDKATMEVPSSVDGKVVELKVKVGDKLSEGSVVAIVEADGAAEAPAKTETPKAEAPKAEAPKAAAAPAPAPAAAHPAPVTPSLATPSTGPTPAAATGRKADIECAIVVIGSGPGGYNAAFRAADLGMDTVLVERYAALGGVCLNVGCIPSKALLHAAAVIEEAAHAKDFGITFGKPAIELDALRKYKDKVVGQLTKGLAGMAKQRKVRTVQGTAKFVSPNELEITTESGGTQLLKFQHCIIAAGSQPVKLPFFDWKDKRIMDSTDALELADIPKTLLVVGGGIIGMEMATVFRALGTEVTVVELMDQLMPGADADLVKPLAARLKKQGVAVHLKTKVTASAANKDGIAITFEGASIPERKTFDRVLVETAESVK